MEQKSLDGSTFVYNVAEFIFWAHYWDLLLKGKKITIFKILLPIDNVPDHPRPVMVMYKMNVVFLPPNTASIL